MNRITNKIFILEIHTFYQLGMFFLKIIINTILL